MRVSIRQVFAPLVLLLLTLAPASARAQDGAPRSTDAISLQPGDVVRVEIWREKDLSGEFPVDPDGTVVLPLLGEKRVTGVGMRDLRRQLEEEYRVHLRNPSITIVPLRRVNVLGAVTKPGMYTIDPTVSLVGAVALAGGSAPEGNIRDVTVVREGQVIRSRPALGETLQNLDVRSGDEIYVGRRGWFDRNSGAVLASVVSLVSGIVTTLIIVNSNNN